MNEFIGDALIGVALIAGAGALVYGAKKLGVTLVPHG